MKNFRYVLFCVLCMFFFPLITHAECDYQRMAELNKIAGNVQFKYSYDLSENGSVQSSVIISNVTSDIYIIDMFGNEYRNFENVAPDTASYFTIYSADQNCNEPIMSKEFSFPIYNIYSTLDECVNNSSLFCNLWQDTTSYSEDEIKKMVAEDRNNNVNELPDVDDENNIIFDYMVKGVICVAIVLIIIVATKLIKKSRQRG